MEKLLRTAILLGMGAAALTKETMETLLDELSKTADRIKEEDLLSHILRKGQEAREDLTRRIAKELEGLIDEAQLATKEDILRLEAKIDKLENSIKGQKGVRPPKKS